jgi:hypothetical protein
LAAQQPTEVGDGVAVQTLRQRGAGPERLREGFAALPPQGLRLDFTDTPPRGMPSRIKLTAVLLHVSGLSMNRAAKPLGVPTPGVMTWIEQFAKAYARKPEPEGRAVVVEPDEMRHCLETSWARCGTV